MFPIPWNKAYRKKDGSLDIIDNVIGGGGGGSELPSYSAADAGKVLGVNAQGQLEWVTVSAGGNRFAVVSTANTSLNATSSAKEVTT